MFKNQGNEYFKKGMIQEAIANYDQAIKLDNTQSIYYSNRSKCHKKLKNYSRALQDVQDALELDDKNIKANLICG